MTKYCHPLGMSVSTNIKYLIGGSTGLAVTLIQTPVTPSVGFSSTCGSLHLLHKATIQRTAVINTSFQGSRLLSRISLEKDLIKVYHKETLLQFSPIFPDLQGQDDPKKF